MNERIHELAVKIGFPMDYENPAWAYEQSIYEFAELIVRECVRYFNEDYQRDFDTMWREDLSKGIKEHFGIEE